jgi:hypothetical protein
MPISLIQGDQPIMNFPINRESRMKHSPKSNDNSSMMIHTLNTETTEKKPIVKQVPSKEVDTDVFKALFNLPHTETDTVVSKVQPQFKNLSSTYVAIVVPITMKDCGRWMAKMYKKLGWMALAKSQGKLHKVDSYLKSIEDLIGSIEMRLAQIKEEEKKYDISIELERARKLKGFAEKLLA